MLMFGENDLILFHISGSNVFIHISDYISGGFHVDVREVDNSFLILQEIEGNNNKYFDIRILRELEQIIFNINKENVEYSLQQTMNLFD